MKVFQSLNCVVCKLPFARKAKEARSPRRLYCGSAMCHECFEKERPLEEGRKHQCVRRDNCFNNPNFAFYLIDVLSQEDSLALSPLGDGYWLAKPFKIPECPICHDEYSNQVDGKKSFSLVCNHLICTECYLKNRTPNTDTEAKEWAHRFTCPICNAGARYDGDALFDRFQDFLNELPMMTRQMEGMRNPRVCDDCKETRSIDKMYHCNKCHLKICPDCVIEKHVSHEKTRLLKKELCEMSEAQQKDTANVVKTYNDLFAEVHKNILKPLKAFGTKLTLKEENCKSISTFGEAKKTLEKCAKLRKDFKTISEELMPHLRRYETIENDVLPYLAGMWGNNDGWKEGWPYKYFYLSCNREASVNAEQKDRFQDFLDELPEVTRQIKGHRVCDGGEDTGSIDKMYYCINCISKVGRK